MERAEKQADRILGGEAMAAREKHWSELGLEEKVERLQRMCAALVNVNNRMAERLEEAHHTAHAHMHDSLGRIGVPPRGLDPFSNMSGQGLRISDHPIR